MISTTCCIGEPWVLSVGSDQPRPGTSRHDGASGRRPTVKRRSFYPLPAPDASGKFDTAEQGVSAIPWHASRSPELQAQARAIARKSSALRLAPPTRAPSTPSTARIAAALLAVPGAADPPV